MSISPAVPKDFLPAFCGLQPSWQWNSYTPGHFYLWFLEGLSDLEPVLVGHRGARILYRYKLKAKYKFCLNQLETGDSLTHTFILPARPTGTQVHLAWSDHCTSRLSTTSGPPIPYTYVDCPPNVDYITQEGNGQFGFTTAHLVQNWDRIDGNPAMHFNRQYVTVLTTGTYRISHYISVTSGDNPCTVSWSLFAGNLAIPVHTDFQVFGAAHETITMQHSQDVALVAAQSIYTSVGTNSPFPDLCTYNTPGDLPFQQIQRIA